jgi:NodT family efflux transporter outer membrane factor (OMF) lipoprotein
MGGLQVRIGGTTAALAVCILLAACTLGPEYEKPSVSTPQSYKESAAANGAWKTATPLDQANRGPWWILFDDPVLHELEKQAAESNQNLVIAQAQYRQARALAQSAKSGTLPTVTAGASVTRFGKSANAYNNTSNNVGPANDFALPVEVSWEADIWGRVRRTVESAQAGAQAAAADMEAVRLSIHAELATNYLLLRSIDRERELLARTIVAYEKTHELTVNRHEGGIASDTDVAQAETQLQTVQAQAVDLRVHRAQLEHAIAVLVGKAPADFSLPAAKAATDADPQPPVVPVGVPSELLERRPDIASAERQMAAANARIGVAKAAFYPTLSLGAVAGFESSKASNWLSWPSRMWSLGPDLSATLFDNDRRGALSDQAQAAYDGTVAAYRQTVLSAFQDVEDNLAALGILAEEARIQNGAVKSAQRSLSLATNRYVGGAASYLDVVVAQAFVLSNERAALDISRRRLTASVRLIKALGGNWQRSSLPSGEAVLAISPVPTKK